MTKKTIPSLTTSDSAPLLNASVRRALEKERRLLLKDIHEQEMQLIESHPGVGHESGDMAEHATEDAQLIALQQLRRGRLYEVERALARLDKGTFGLCEHCGQPISPERLEVLPTAALCIHCAQAHTIDPSR